MFTDGTKGEIINLGNPEEYKIIDLADKVKKLTNSNSGGETADEDDTGERKDGDCGCSSTRRRSGLPWGAPVVVAMTLLVRRRR